MLLGWLLVGETSENQKVIDPTTALLLRAFFYTQVYICLNNNKLKTRTTLSFG